MLVSIIIPVYNVSNYIERCLHSVFSQTYENLEIILIDDCSLDDSIVLAKKLISQSSKVDKVRIITHDKNKGLSATRNSGIKHSSGEYIFFLDSDDTISIDAIEHFVKLAKKDYPDFLIGNILRISPNRRKEESVLCEKIETNIEIFDAYLNYKWYPMAWNKLVKKSFLLENNLLFKEGIYHEDNLWSFMLASCATSMVVCPYITYYYYLNVHSITNNIKQKNIDDLSFIYNQIVLISDKNPLKNSPSLIIYLYNFRAKILLLSLQFGYKYWKKIYIKLSNKKDLDSITNKSLPLKFQIKIKIDNFPLSLIYFVYNILNKKRGY